MNRFFFTLAFASVLLIVPVAAQTQTKVTPAEKSADPAPGGPFSAYHQFSAVMNGGLSREHDRQVKRSGNALRLDFGDFYRVTDLVDSTTWTVYPDRCVKFPMGDVGTLLFRSFKNFNIQRIVEPQTETIDGHSCRIETLQFSGKEANSNFEMKVWKAEDLKGFPVRIDFHNPTTNRTTTYTFSNVNLDTPEAKLFAHPDTCGALAVTDKTTKDPASGGVKPKAKPAPKAPSKPAQDPPKQ